MEVVDSPPQQQPRVVWIHIVLFFDYSIWVRHHIVHILCVCLRVCVCVYACTYAHVWLGVIFLCVSWKSLCAHRSRTGVLHTSLQHSCLVNVYIFLCVCVSVCVCVCVCVWVWVCVSEPPLVLICHLYDRAYSCISRQTRPTPAL